MSRKWEDVLAILRGEKSVPLSQFIGYSGVLTGSQQEELFAALAKSDFRRAIRFKGCKIDDKGACRLAEILMQNRLITSLELPGNAIGKEGAMALCRLLQENRGITGFDVTGNPCEEACPETMNQIEIYLDRNRELLSCNGSTCPSPNANSPRMQRTKARIVDVSNTTHHLRSPSPRQSRHTRQLGYGSDCDGLSMKSEQMSTCSEDGDFQTRILLLEERQTKLEQQADQLDQDAEELHEWRKQFQQSSQNAMESFLKYEAQVQKSRKELEELLSWKGSMEVILEVNSVKIQRQGGDFHGLRDKVMKLHSEFERVSRRTSLTDGLLPQTPNSVGSVSQRASSSHAAQDKQENLSLQEMSEKVRNQNETQKELLEEFNKTRAMLEDVMRYYENCEHANATSKTNFESRIASLEKNGIISEEDQASQSALSEALNGLEVFRTAIELQVEKIEKRVVNAEILAQKLENAKSDSRSTKHVEGKFEAQCAEQKQAINALQSKIEEYEVAAIQARKGQYDNRKDLSDLQNQMATALANNRTLESRLNFQEELIMDKTHGEQSLDSAVEAHATRLDSFEEQLKMLEVHTPRIAVYERQIKTLEEQASKLEKWDDRMQSVEARHQELKDLKQKEADLEQRLNTMESSGASTSSVSNLKEEIEGWNKALREDVKTSSTQCKTWVGEVRGCLKETETRLQKQIDAIMSKIQKAETSHNKDMSNMQSEVSNLSSNMQNLFTQLDAHLHAVEEQSSEIAKKLQAEKSWKSSCASKLKALENASQARQEKDVETSKTLETLSEGIKGLKNDQETVLETLEGLSAYNKQLNIKELPKRLAVLETQMQALQQERQQMPNWVKKQANMENRMEKLEESLMSFYNDNSNAALQQAANTKFSGQTMYCMAKRYPVSHPVQFVLTEGIPNSESMSDSLSIPESPSEFKENENSNSWDNSNAGTKQSSKGSISPNKTIESNRVLMPKVC